MLAGGIVVPNRSVLSHEIDGGPWLDAVEYMAPHHRSVIEVDDQDCGWIRLWHHGPAAGHDRRALGAGTEVDEIAGARAARAEWVPLEGPALVTDHDEVPVAAACVQHRVSRKLEPVTNNVLSR
ncbi:MAG: hypothetical protein ACI8TP_002661 [Acidimicrobiales bacterium]|jgi:hypothetical protein